MHICEDHEEMLPAGVPPLLLPDTCEQAHHLLLCLEIGLYPTVLDGILRSEYQPTETNEFNTDPARDR